VTLADLAADRRAATPSEAAELLVPSADELRDQLLQCHRRLLRPLQHQLRVLRSRLEAIESRPLFARPHQSISDRRHRLDDLDLRSKRAVLQQVERARQRLLHATATLEAYSPLAVLQRGYSVTQREGEAEPLRDAAALQVGERLTTRLHHGQVTSRVERTEPSS
jgi:exodeoxyribonuclease VII large subunit